MPISRNVSILCPIYNEEASIPIFYGRLKTALEPFQAEYQFSIVFLNNGSSDHSFEVITDIRKEDSRVQIVTLSRNVKAQRLMKAGLEMVSGDAFIMVDVDGEDPPEMISDFIRGWEKGYDLVYGLREKRIENFVVHQLRKSFYRIMWLIADDDFILDMGDFCLFTDRVRQSIIKNKTCFPFIRYDLARVGFRRLGIPYTRQRRINGKTHYNFLQLVVYSLTATLTASTLPLRLGAISGVGLGILNIFFVYLALVSDSNHWINVTITLDLGFLVVLLSVLSLYVARIYRELPQAPTYVVDNDKTIRNS